jgi:hypothetical protein
MTAEAADAILVSDRGLRHGVLAERFAAHDPLMSHGTRGPTGAV